MTRARYTQVSLDSTPYYHCICHCVRRAFFVGRITIPARITKISVSGRSAVGQSWRRSLLSISVPIL